MNPVHPVLTGAPRRCPVCLALTALLLLVACAGVSAAGAASAREAESGPVAGVKVIVFDVYGTVVDCRGSLVAEGQALGLKKGLQADWVAFADQWISGYVQSVRMVRNGELPWTRLDALLRTSLDDLLGRSGIEGLTDAEKDDFARAWRRLQPWPDTIEGLTGLRQRFVIAPLSNGNLGMMADLARQVGLPWDCILSAELVRHYKPDGEVYLSVMEFFDLAPDEVMMVAAHRSDLEGPKALGMKTAYIYRPTEEPDPPSLDVADIVVSDIRELALALGL